MIPDQLYLWGGFTLFILALLGLDLGLFQRRPHVIGMRESLAWFAAWTGLAMLFNIGVVLFHPRGGEAGMEFLTGYLIEKSLSIDNIFVFLLIFSYFHVPPVYQHKVLFWGIVGAILLRVVFIVAGLALLEKFHWMTYVFGGFLVVTGIGMMLRKEAKYDPERNWLLRAVRRVLPLSDTFEGNRFFTRIDGRLAATPLLLVLVAIESSDIVFAADSIPAIFAVTPDPFIVYTSNIFAMLGLRTLYFAVAGFMRMFHFLHYGFASIILILGAKMLLADVYKVPVEASLALVIFILLVCVIVSLLRPRSADLKPLFERTERLGLIPFRRLLLIENVIDLADLTVRDAMCSASFVRVLRMDLPWEDNLATIRATRYSRYPLVEREGARPLGVIHLKNLFIAGASGPIAGDELKRLARPCPTMSEDLPLEDALARFQGRFDQMAIVQGGRDEWTGIITVEDVLEELVGRIGDEFDVERAGKLVSLADALTPGRVVFALSAGSLTEAIESLVARIPREDLPADPEAIVQAVVRREQALATYVGRGLAIPHARFEGIDKPLLAFARSDEGVPLEDSSERAELIFLLLTPSRMSRTQPRLLAEIVGLFESQYVTERLRKATSPDELIEVIRAGQQLAHD